MFKELKKHKFLILLVFIFFILFYKPFPVNVKVETFNGLKSKLKDWTFYGRESCPWCRKQKDVLREANVLDIVEYIDCAENRDACASIKGVPHWKNKKTGEESKGFKDLDALNKLN